jgi:hypothetical protein
MPKFDWKKSPYSGEASCVEVKSTGDAFLVRDTKNPDGAVLEFTNPEWMAFVAGVHMRYFGG